MLFVVTIAFLAVASAAPAADNTDNDKLDEELNLLLRMLKEERNEIDQRYISRIEDTGSDWGLIHLGRTLKQKDEDGYFSLKWKCESCENGDCPADQADWKDSVKGWNTWAKTDICGRDIPGCVKIENLQPSCTFNVRDGYRATMDDTPTYTVGARSFDTQAGSQGKRDIVKVDKKYISRIEDAGSNWALIHLGRDLQQKNENGYFSLQWRCGSCDNEECPADEEEWVDSVLGWRRWSTTDICGRNIPGCVRIENLRPSCTYFARDGYKQYYDDEATWTARNPDKSFKTLAAAPAKRTEIDQRYISRIEDVGADWALIHMGRNLVQTSDDGFFSLQWRCGSCQEIEGEQRECPSGLEEWQDSTSGWRTWENLDICGKDIPGCVKINGLTPACTYFVRDGYKKESDSDPVYTERKPTDKQFITLLELAGSSSGEGTTTTAASNAQSSSSGEGTTTTAASNAQSSSSGGGTTTTLASDVQSEESSEDTTASDAQGDNIEVSSGEAGGQMQQMNERMGSMEVRLTKIEDVLKKMAEDLAGMK